jgi:hypothetical protein
MNRSNARVPETKRLDFNDELECGMLPVRVNVMSVKSHTADVDGYITISD